MKNVARGALIVAGAFCSWSCCGGGCEAASRSTSRSRSRRSTGGAHLRDHAREPLEVERARRPERAVHQLARAARTRSPTNYYGVTHPSEPNYVAAISGSNWFINNDNPSNRFNHTNIVDQLEAKQLTLGRVHGVDAVRRLHR